MAESEKEKQNKKIVTEVKTFPVPFSSTGINESISISPNSSKKASKEKPHPLIKGKTVNFKYAVQVSVNPITIKIFTNFPKDIKSSGTTGGGSAFGTAYHVDGGFNNRYNSRNYFLTK